MRKNTARHWLHAALDLLPVILIPVFMIYSHRHVMTEQTTVDIQYKYQSNEVNSLDDLVIGNIYQLDNIEFNLARFDSIGTSQNITIYAFEDILSFNDNATIEEIYLTENFNGEGYITFYYDSDDQNLFIYLLDAFNDNYISLNYNYNTNAKFQFVNCILAFDNLEAFQTYCDDYHYLPQCTDYNVIESVDVQDTNSSIMNVFMDDFNYSVDKYFNMGNVFNLKDVYHWFEVNIFNNNPPVVMASIYNIIVYEFIMDLLFLLYGLFMWFIDMLKRLIEKPIDSIK